MSLLSSGSAPGFQLDAASRVLILVTEADFEGEAA
jgi:hypothetical protein